MTQQIRLKNPNILKLEDVSTVSQAIKRPRRRRRQDSEKLASSIQDDYPPPPEDDSDPFGSSHMISIEIGDMERIKEYLYNAFTSFLQINCRTLCKAWIRTIEPKKQVNYPYNGNRKKMRMSSSDPPLQREIDWEMGSGMDSEYDLEDDLEDDEEIEPEKDSERTKPEWWPPKEVCPHREPDHIKKEGRCSQT